MIGYVTLGTNDLPRAAKFYDALLALIGGKRFMEMERAIAWSSAAGGSGISVGKPFDGRPATVGNGVMVALTASSREKVDALYAKKVCVAQLFTQLNTDQPGKYGGELAMATAAIGTPPPTPSAVLRGI